MSKKNDKIVREIDFSKYIDINTSEKIEAGAEINIVTKDGIIKSMPVSEFAANAIGDERVKQANSKISGLSLELNKRRIAAKNLRKENGNFMFVFLKWFEEVSKLGLSGAEYQVLMFLLSKMEFNSHEFKMTQQKITDEINEGLEKAVITRSTVSRALVRLMNLELIYRVEGGKDHYYLINKSIGFCGSIEYAETIYLRDKI